MTKSPSYLVVLTLRANSGESYSSSFASRGAAERAWQAARQSLGEALLLAELRLGASLLRSAAGLPAAPPQRAPAPMPDPQGVRHYPAKGREAAKGFQLYNTGEALGLF